MHDWLGRAAVERLRLWPVLERVVGAVEENDAFAGAILIGSLVRGEGDSLSDVDLVVVAKPGAWVAAWAARHELSSDSLYCWDRLEPGFPDLGAHRWFTPDLIKVECPITTPRGGFHLRGPFAVVAGEENLAEEIERLPALTPEEIAQYVHERAAAGKLDEAERLYGDLKNVLRGNPGS